jgi:hypothetical protein
MRVHVRGVLGGLLVSVCAMAFAQHAAAQPCNRVANGGFESGSLSGWATANTSNFTDIIQGSFGGVDPHGGTHQLYSGEVGTPGTISQVISANVGDTVTVSFWLANFGGTPNSFSADLGAQNLLSLTDGPAQPYTLYTYTVVVTAANPTLSFSMRHDPSFWLLDDIVVATAGTSACCDPVAGVCTVVTGGAACPGGLVAAPAGSPCCTPNLCPHPTACCTLDSGICSVAPLGSPCPPGSSPAGNGDVLSCTPFPCAIPGSGCFDCTYVNGPYDGRDGQLSHLGGGTPHGAKAADDFLLTEDFIHHLNTVSATILTTTFPGLVKPIAEIWSDCNGCPGELLYKLENASVIETGATAGNAFDGRPLRIVHATWMPSDQPVLNNRAIALRGGRYWLSVYGQSDNLGPTMGMYDVTYWGTSAQPVKGKPAYKIDGNPGNAYGVYSFPTGCGPAAWHSVADDCCIGCTDLNFSVCTDPCKIIVNNGDARQQIGNAPNGSTSQFAPGSWSPAETRSADDFVLAGCQDYRICYVEACVLTNCQTFQGVFELYDNDCNKPSYALNGQPINNTQFVATKVVPLGPAYTSTIDGRTLQAYRLEFHNVDFYLSGGSQYWISVGVRSTFSLNERAYFCYNQYCDGRCPIKWNEGRVLTSTTLDADAAAHGCVSPAPVTGCNGWAKTGNDFSFLIAAEAFDGKGKLDLLPGGSSTPGCRVDYNQDGSVNPQDVFDFLNAWFTGCP